MSDASSHYGESYGESISIFVFRRDLRVYDNTALSACCEEARRLGRLVIPIFIFDRQQTDPSLNAYYTERGFRYMLDALVGLGSRLPSLRCTETEVVGDGGIAVLARIARCHPASPLRIWYSADLTPYAKRRDARIRAWADANGHSVTECKQGYTLLPLERVANKSGRAYRVFTPFHRVATETLSASPVPPRPARIRGTSFLPLEWGVFPDGEMVTTMMVTSAGGGGTSGDESSSHRHHRPPHPRTVALGVLRRIRRGSFSDYADKRRDIHTPTTRLGAALKYGVISAREAYAACIVGGDRDAELARQLLWREFFYHIADDDGESDTQPSSPRWRRVSESRDAAEAFGRWTRGETGDADVDAAMRLLESSGHLHNRQRMLVATHLVHFMGVDWRDGERYFASKLEDYDRINNNAGWRKVAMTPRFKLVTRI